MYREDCEMIGVDFCEKFVEICKSKNKNVLVGNCMSLPFNKDTFEVEALASLKSAKLTYSPDKYKVVNSFPRVAYGKINKIKLKKILSIN